jgi:hypothetical protein
MMQRPLVSVLRRQLHPRNRQRVSLWNGPDRQGSHSNVATVRTIFLGNSSRSRFGHRYLSSNEIAPRADSTPEGALRSKDGVVGHPIDFDVRSKIEGNESQVRNTYQIFCRPSPPPLQHTLPCPPSGTVPMIALSFGCDCLALL